MKRWIVGLPLLVAGLTAGGTSRTPAPGIPFGLIGTWDGTDLKPNTDFLTMTYGLEKPGTLVPRIEIAQSRGLRMVITMTGGGA